jgi:hypothetical protein
VVCCDFCCRYVQPPIYVLTLKCIAVSEK